mmetsp:Transcript_2523/g.5237  ORF Transcript_2523/g.5237 Transcript_2523/m.5237 type:complete len:994 (-) Transcript_2523:437-3418(-)
MVVTIIAEESSFRFRSDAFRPSKRKSTVRTTRTATRTATRTTRKRQTRRTTKKKTSCTYDDRHDDEAESSSIDDEEERHAQSSGILHCQRLSPRRQQHFAWLSSYSTGIVPTMDHLSATHGYRRDDDDEEEEEKEERDERITFLPYSSKKKWEKTYPMARICVQCDKRGKLKVLGDCGHHDGEGGDREDGGETSEGKTKKKNEGLRSTGRTSLPSGRLSDDERRILHEEVCIYLAWLCRELSDLELSDRAANSATSANRASHGSCDDDGNDNDNDTTIPKEGRGKKTARTPPKSHNLGIAHGDLRRLVDDVAATLKVYSSDVVDSLLKAYDDDNKIVVEATKDATPSDTATAIHANSTDASNAAADDSTGSNPSTSHRTTATVTPSATTSTTTMATATPTAPPPMLESLLLAPLNDECRKPHRRDYLKQQRLRLRQQQQRQHRERLKQQRQRQKQLEQQQQKQSPRQPQQPQHQRPQQPARKRPRTSKQQTNATFSELYQKLLAYRSRHGHTNVPTKNNRNKRRKSNTNNTNSRNESNIDENNNANNTKESQQQQQNPNSNSNSNSNSNLDPDPDLDQDRLGYWVYRLRRKRRLIEETTGKTHMEDHERDGIVDSEFLSEERIRMLDDLGFTWRFVTRSWEENFETLKKFIEEHGHSCVPRKHEIGEWVHGQRRQWAKNDPKFLNGRAKKLEEIGFEFKPPPRPHLGNASFVGHSNWEYRISQIKEYKLIHGNLNVPTPDQFSVHDDPQTLEFYNWFNRLQTEYVAFRNGRTRKYLNEERVQQLIALGCQFRAPQHRMPDDDMPIADISCDARIEQLLAYRAEMGHLKICPSYRLFGNLGGWAEAISTKYRNWKEGKEHCSAEMVKKFERLAEIGFEFDVVREQKKRTWEDNFNKLLEYKRQTGHTVIPTKLKSDMKLGVWANIQRAEYDKMCRGVPSKLTQERLDRLSELRDSYNLYCDCDTCMLSLFLPCCYQLRLDSIGWASNRETWVDI